jgi:hypothetical protein
MRRISLEYEKQYSSRVLCELDYERVTGLTVEQKLALIQFCVVFYGEKILEEASVKKHEAKLKTKFELSMLDGKPCLEFSSSAPISKLDEAAHCVETLLHLKYYDVLKSMVNSNKIAIFLKRPT